MAAVLGLAAVLAVWMDLSPVHRFHNSDSLIPVLMSLDRWTPFYWEQNRFGMLVPLLALPFQDPFTNLLVQVALRLFALVLSFFLLARTVVRRPWWPAVGALTLGLFLAGKDLPQHNFQQMQPYFQALALALPGVALLERPGGWRTLAAGALFALAFWVAPVTLFWLVPLLALRGVLLSPVSLKSLLSLRSLLPFLLAALAFGGSLLASRLSVYHQTTELGLAPAADWPRAWLALAGRVADFLGPWLLAGIGFLLLASLAPGPHPRPGVRASALCLLGTAAAELLILGTSGWVHLNEFRPRFLAVTLLATATAGTALLLGLLLEGRPERWGRVVNALALAALLPLTLWRFGPPSPAAARAALAAGPDADTVRDLVADGCTHVLGEYWRVWPAVVQARVLLRERGEARQVWGIAYRSTPTADLWRWRDWRPARIAVLGPPRSAERVRAFYRIPPFGDPRGPVRCAAGQPMVSFRGFRLPVRPESAGAMLPEEPETR
jgi:hypothetical protein